MIRHVLPCNHRKRVIEHVRDGKDWHFRFHCDHPSNEKHACVTGPATNGTHSCLGCDWRKSETEFVQISVKNDKQAAEEDRVLNTPRISEKCKHFGEFKRFVDCNCSIKSKVFFCNSPDNPSGECTVRNQKAEDGLPACDGCQWRKIPDEFLPRPNPPVPHWSEIPDICFHNPIDPKWFHFVDNDLLKRGADNFNASLIRWRGRLFMAYRHGYHAAEMRFTEFDHDLVPKRDLPINVRILRRRNYAASEDPRLFLRGDQLWIAYNGVAYDRDKKKVVTMCTGQIDESGKVISSRWSDYARSRLPFGDCEKNWSFFDHDGGLNCIYQPEPTHVILRSNDTAEWFDQSEVYFPGLPELGLRRGGAMPWLHNGEWYHFCHTIADCPNPRKGGTNRFYTVALYTFDSKPPFAPRRKLPFPLLSPSRSVEESHNGRIVFVCGAFYEAGRWVISGGWQDKRIFVASYDAKEIERQLRPIV